MSEARLRRVLLFVTPAVILAYYVFFVWPGLKLYFDNDDMMNLYFAWSRPLLSSYRPLGALFYRTMFALAGFHPLPFRIVCVALGAVNLGLCFWFAKLVSHSDRVAALAVLLFAFHSRMMEVWFRTAVVYDLLCFTFFYLAACLYMSKRRVGLVRGLAAIACFVCALEAKEIAVGLPVILLVWTLIMRGEEIELTEAEVERRAWEAFHKDLPALAEAYRKKFGTEIGTDNAREIVSAEYAESIEARTRWSRATQKPAGALSDYLFEEALRNPDPDRRRIAIFTAGGTGAGKTTAIARLPGLSTVQFVFDSNLGSKKSSVQKIEAAKAAGFQIEVHFVHRDPIEALAHGVLPRAMSEGRAVDLDAHARMYRDAAENFSFLLRKYSADAAVRFQATDNSRIADGPRPLPLEKAKEIRYSTTVLIPRLRAALEEEYGAGRISEAVYRATLGPPAGEARSGLLAHPGRPDLTAGSDAGSVRSPLGHHGLPDDGKPEEERSGSDGEPEAQPGSVIVSLWVPLTCGLLDIPYLWFKTHGASALTAIADYQPEYTFTRFAHTWALYLNFLFLRTDQILPWMAIGILALLLVAALAVRSKKLFFAWAMLFVPVLPVAFLAYRGAFVLYASYPGWTLYAAIALVAAQDLFTKYKLAIACAVFLIVGWRFGKLNLHDQRADPRSWLYRSPAQVRQMAREVAALEPALPQGARCLFVNDPFPTDEWTPYFIMKLLYRDDTLVPDRVKMMDRKPADWSGYQYVFTFEDGKYRLLKP